MAADFAVGKDEVVVEEVGGENISDDGMVKSVADPRPERMHAEESAFLA